MSESPTYAKIALAYRWCVDVTPAVLEVVKKQWLEYRHGRSTTCSMDIIDLYGDPVTIDLAQVVFCGTTSREGRRQCNRLDAILVQEQEDDTPAEWEKHL